MSDSNRGTASARGREHRAGGGVVHVTVDDVHGKRGLHELVAGNAAGTTFLFAPGVYELTDTVEGAVIHKSVTFRSDRSGEAVLRGDPAMAVGDGSVGLDVKPDIDGFVIEGFVIESFDTAIRVHGAAGATRPVVVRSNTFRNYGERAIELERVVGAVIGHNSLASEQPQRGGSDAISVGASQRVLIHDNDLRGAAIPIQVLPIDGTIVANNRVLRLVDIGRPGGGPLGMILGEDLRTSGHTRNCHTLPTSHFGAVVGNEVVAPPVGDPGFHSGFAGLLLVGPDEIDGLLVVDNSCENFRVAYDVALQANGLLLAGNRSSGSRDADYVLGEGRETPGGFDQTDCGPAHDDVVVMDDSATAIGGVGRHGNVVIAESALGGRVTEVRALLSDVRTEVDRVRAEPERLAESLTVLKVLYDRIREIATSAP